MFELELAGCNEITEAGLWACLTPRIVALTLTDCINIADEAMGAVAQLLPSLYEFSLQAYHVSDAALGYFSPKQSNSLSILRLHSCWEVTNHGMDNIGKFNSIFTKKKKINRSIDYQPIKNFPFPFLYFPGGKTWNFFVK